MKFCLYVPPFGPFSDPRVLAQFAKTAERAGWDGFFIWDHIAGERYPKDIADPWVALACIALSTSKIKIGALVTPLARRRPWKVARETVSIDQISNGRLVFGVGTGSGSGEFEHLGEEPDPKIRGELLDEALEILLALWSGKTINHTGEHYRIKDTCFLPTPVQQPRIPIWAAAIWPNRKPLRRAARFDGVFPLFPNAKDEAETKGQLEEMTAYLNEHRNPADPFDIVFRGFKLPVDDPDQARRLIKPYEDLGVTWWQTSISPREFGGTLMDERWPLDQMERAILQGPPKINS